MRKYDSIQTIKRKSHSKDVVGHREEPFPGKCLIPVQCPCCDEPGFPDMDCDHPYCEIGRNADTLSKQIADAVAAKLPKKFTKSDVKKIAQEEMYPTIHSALIEWSKLAKMAINGRIAVPKDFAELAQSLTTVNLDSILDHTRSVADVHDDTEHMMGLTFRYIYRTLAVESMPKKDSTLETTLETQTGKRWG